MLTLQLTGKVMAKQLMHPGLLQITQLLLLLLLGILVICYLKYSCPARCVYVLKLTFKSYVKKVRIAPNLLCIKDTVKN